MTDQQRIRCIAGHSKLTNSDCALRPWHATLDAYLHALEEEFEDVGLCDEPLDVVLEPFSKSTQQVERHDHEVLVRWIVLVRSLQVCLPQTTEMMQFTQRGHRKCHWAQFLHDAQLFIWQISTVRCFDLGLITHEILVERLLDERHTSAVDGLTIRQESWLQSRGHAGQTLHTKDTESNWLFSYTNNHDPSFDVIVRRDQKACPAVVVICDDKFQEMHLLLPSLTSRRGNRSLSSSLRKFHFSISGGISKFMYSCKVKTICVHWREEFK